MKHYFSITVKVAFGILAESQEEAESLAAGLCDIENDIPARSLLSVEAYHTPNQSDAIKQNAVNFDYTQPQAELAGVA